MIFCSLAWEKEMATKCELKSIEDFIQIVSKDLGSNQYRNELHISDSGLGDLIRLAYYSSQKPEEGRFPFIRFVVSDFEGDGFVLAKSEESKGISIEQLKAYSPILSRRPYFLAVKETNGDLQICGFRDGTNAGIDYQWGPSPVLPGGGRSIFFEIEAVAPGRIEVRSNALSTDYSYVNGKIAIPENNTSPLTELTRTIPVVTLAKKFSSLVVEYLSRKKLNSEFATQPRQHELFLRLLDRTLRHVRDSCHGGCFVFGQFSHTQITRLNKISDLSLLQTACSWLENYQSAIALRQDCIEMRRAGLYQRKAFEQAQLIGAMGCVDGCVLIDQDFSCVGFGGQITVEDDLPGNVTCFIDGEKRTVEEFTGSNAGGMRHRSAGRLIMMNPDRLAIVVSQDGGISVFSSEGKICRRINTRLADLRSTIAS